MKIYNFLFFPSLHEKWQSERAIATKNHTRTNTHARSHTGFAESHNDICLIYNKIIRTLFLSLFFSSSVFVLSCSCFFSLHFPSRMNYSKRLGFTVGLGHNNNTTFGSVYVLHCPFQPYLSLFPLISFCHILYFFLLLL